MWQGFSCYTFNMGKHTETKFDLRTYGKEARARKQVETLVRQIGSDGRIAMRLMSQMLHGRHAKSHDATTRNVLTTKIAAVRVGLPHDPMMGDE